MNIKRVLKKEILFISFLFSFFRIDGFMLSDQQIILGLQCILSTYKDISEKQEWDVLYQKMLPIATAAILPNTVPLRSMNTEYQTHHAEIIHRNFSTPSIISILETAAPLFFNNRFLALKTIEFLKDHALLQNIPYTVLTKTNLLQPLTKTDIEKLYQPFFDMVTDASLKVNLFKEFFKYHYAKNNYLDFFYENSASLIAYDSTIQTTCKSLIDYAKKQEESHNIVIYVNLSSSILLYQDLATLMDSINERPMANTPLLNYAHFKGGTSSIHELFETSVIPFYYKANSDVCESHRDCVIQKYKTNESALPFCYDQFSSIAFKSIREDECEKHCFVLLKKLEKSFNKMVTDYGNYGVIAAISVPEKNKDLIINTIQDFKIELKLNEYLFNPEEMQKHNITITYFSPILSEIEKESRTQYKALLSRITKIIKDRHTTKKCVIPLGDTIIHNTPSSPTNIA